MFVKRFEAFHASCEFSIFSYGCVIPGFGLDSVTERGRVRVCQGGRDSLSMYVVRCCTLYSTCVALYVVRCTVGGFPEIVPGLDSRFPILGLYYYDVHIAEILS
jgi:hypothetical protein